MERDQATTTDRPPLRLIHASAPEGCTSETTSTVPTAAGPVTIRVRRLAVQDYVGGRGYVDSQRIEVAVNAPGTDGFETIETHYLEGPGGGPSRHRGAGRQPELDLSVHIAFGARLQEVAEKRQAAPDRDPARRGDRSPEDRRPARLYKGAAHRLHVVLGARGVRDHNGFASSVVGRTVRSFRELSADEMLAVETASDDGRGMGVAA